MPEEFRSLITPQLLEHLVEARIPWPHNESLDFAKVGFNLFRDNTFGPAIKEEAWPVLQKMSKIPLDSFPIPALMDLLPEPSSPEFPRQCLGMQLLLDQVWRASFAEVDTRWGYGFFHRISVRFADSWRGLEESQRPDSWARWRDLGYSIDYWIMARLFFIAPHIHEETLEYQAIGLQLTEEARVTVEKTFGVTDPWRAKRDEVLSDLFGFPRIIVNEGPPQGDDVTASKWWFWMARLIDVHQPIIARFGRYPDHNDKMGRVSTEDELWWLKEADNFDQMSPEAAKQIREDVEAGRWTPMIAPREGAGKDI